MKIESLDLRGGCLVDGGVTLTWYVDCDGNDPEEFKRAHWPIGVWYQRRPNDFVWMLINELDSEVSNQQYRQVIRTTINQETTTSSLRDVIYTARGFLLRGIQSACGDQHKEINEWKVYWHTLLSIGVKECVVGAHTTQYTLPDGSTFEAERMDS